MKGTSFGNWVARAFQDELLSLTPEQMPEQSHWEPDHKRVCDGVCKTTFNNAMMKAIEDMGTEGFKKFKESVEMELLDEGAWTCPYCGGNTRSSYGGKRIEDGRYFYGLTFHDPDFDPGKARIGVDCHDRTMGKGSEGKTVAEAEDAGESLGLERYQAFYSASAKQPDSSHRVPLIDGGCGFDQVVKILEAIVTGKRCGKA